MALGENIGLPNPFRFIVSYHDRRSLLQKIDPNKKLVFSMPLDYFSFDACKKAGTNANLHALPQSCFGRKRRTGCNQLAYLPQVKYQRGLVGYCDDSDKTFCFECLCPLLLAAAQEDIARKERHNGWADATRWRPRCSFNQRTVIGNLELPKPFHEDLLTTGERVRSPPLGIWRRGVQQCIWVNAGKRWHLIPPSVRTSGFGVTDARNP